MATTLGERLRWARYNGPAARKAGKVIGATILARRAGCAQSLISSLERQNARGSEHSDKFADALDVDRAWLATGEGAEPEGFEENAAREMREMGGARLLSIVHSATPTQPRWAREPLAGSQSPAASRVAHLRKTLMTDFMDFAELVGKGRAKAYLDFLCHYVDHVLPQSTAPEDHS